MIERIVILHYHLFKNAGTSVDRILQDNFGSRWVTKEFPLAHNNNSSLVAEWIQENPSAIAFSSHTMVGPVPKIPGVRIVTLTQLRDPIARINSAYRFERKQDKDAFGPVLAKNTSLEGYVRVRLSLKNDRQCRNFQTSRMSSLVPGDMPELDRARAAISHLDIVGRVETFDHTLDRMREVLIPHFPSMVINNVHANKSRSSSEGAPESVTELLREHNQDDMALLEYLKLATAGAGTTTPAYSTQMFS